jgi:hypothetical protein
LNGFYYFCHISRVKSTCAFDADIADTTDTDIKTIKVVLGGAGLNEANDKLILDAEIIPQHF